MKFNPLQSGLTWVYEHFRHNTAKMLIATGTVGWLLSSIAQAGAVLFNPKISKEKKSYLIPQELTTGVANVCTFLLITLSTQKIVSKLCSTGKLAPTKVRKFLNQNKDLYGNKVGKLSLDLDKVLEKEPKFPTKSYYAFKNITTTGATVGASVVAGNIVTPIVSNIAATKAQKKYIETRTINPVKPMSYSGNMKI